MHKSLLSLFVLLALVGLFSQNEVQSFSSTPPSGRTNAPGESNCGTSSCHSGGGLNMADSSLLSLTHNGVQVNNSIRYQLDQSYDLLLELINPQQSRYGFQITALDGNDNKAGTFTTSDARATIQNANDRQYVAHNGANTTTAWNFTWQAPSTDLGDVTFYMIANDANGSGSGGDVLYTRTVTIMADTAQDTMMVSLNAIDSDEEVYLYPTLADQTINVSGQGVFAVQVFDATGKLVWNHEASYEHTIQKLPVFQLERGWYFTKIHAINGTSHHKFYKR